MTEGGTIEGSLRLQRGVTVSGRIDPDTLSSVDPQKLRVELWPVTSPADWEAATLRATPNATGRFSIVHVVPGSYRVRVTGLPKEWSLGSANFGEVDAADVNLVIKGEPVSGGILMLTSSSASLAGSLSNAAGEPVNDRVVLLFPSQTEFWVAASRRIHVVQPGAEGRYAFSKLPAGSYRLVAIDAPEPAQQFDHDFLAGLWPGRARSRSPQEKRASTTARAVSSPHPASRALHNSSSSRRPKP